MSDVVSFGSHERTLDSRLTAVEISINVINEKLSEHVIQQKDDNKIDTSELKNIKTRLALIESIHEREAAVKAEMTKWVKWLYGIGAALIGILVSEAFRRVPLRLAIFASAAAVTSCMSYAANAATFYVAPTGSNSNAGTQSSPWATLGYAATRVQPGDEIACTGTHATSLRTTASGTANARIRYFGSPSGSCRITPPANNASEIAWEQAGDYVTIDGIEIDGSQHQSDTRWRTGIKLVGRYNTVQQSVIHDVGVGQITTSIGILVEQTATNVDISANTINRIGSQ